MSKFRTDQIIKPHVRSTRSTYVVREADGTTHLTTGHTRQEAIATVRDQAYDKGQPVMGHLVAHVAVVEED